MIMPSRNHHLKILNLFDPSIGSIWRLASWEAMAGLIFDAQTRGWDPGHKGFPAISTPPAADVPIS
jgi:hypothetical protein